MAAHLKDTARSVMDAVSLGILHTPPVEKLIVGMLRRMPRGRGTQFVSESLRRAANRLDSPYRLTSIDEGCHLLINLRDFLGPVYLCGDPYEPETTLIFKSVLRDGDTVLDVGANAGFYTLIAAKAVGPTGRVHAFEPNPAMLGSLRKSVEASGFSDRLVANDTAVADACREGRKLYLSTNAGNSGLSSLVIHEQAKTHGLLRDEESIEVETISLDAYVEQQGIQHCRLLKIDVEGAEPAVVQGMQQFLASAVADFILCETSVEGEADRRIRASGYRGFLPPHVDKFHENGTARLFANVLYAAPGRELPEALRSFADREISSL